MTLFTALVETTAAVAATTKRSAKIAAFAELLGRLDAEERIPAVAWLVGEPRQGRGRVGDGDRGGGVPRR